MKKIYKEQQKKICLISDAWIPVWGGGQSHIWELAQKLVHKNCQISIIVPNLLAKEMREKIELSNYENLKIIHLGPSFVFPNFLGRTTFAIVSALFVLRSDFDMLHSHSYSTCLAAILKKIFSPRTKIFFTPHGGGVAVLGGGIINHLSFPKVLDFLVRKIIPYDGLIGVLPSDIAGFSLAKKKIIIGNGVDVTKFKKESISRRNQVFTFLNVGRLVPVKNQENLVRGFAEVVRKFPSVRLTIIGDGELARYLTELINKLNMKSYVKLLGPLPLNEMPTAYNQVDAFILPSTFEGQPISLLEAMSSSVPVIVSNAGGSSSIVKSAGCGLILSSTDVYTIRDSLKKILSLNKNELEKMGHLGRLWVTKNASWDEISERIFNFYTQK